jgi:hypothetical protein
VSHKLIIKWELICQVDILDTIYGLLNQAIDDDDVIRSYIGDDSVDEETGIRSYVSDLESFVSHSLTMNRFWRYPSTFISGEAT